MPDAPARRNSSYLCKYMQTTEPADLLRNFLKNIPQLSDKDIALLTDTASYGSFKKGTVLLREGEVNTKCYFLLRGCVREYVVKDGVEKTTNFYTEYQSLDTFIDAANPVPSKFNLVCLEDCIVTVSKSSLIEELCRTIPHLESIVLQEVQQAGSEAQDEMARFITSSPEERYLHLLETRPDLFQRVPQHLIASYIGVTAESLSRIRKRIGRKSAPHLKGNR